MVEKALSNSMYCPLYFGLAAKADDPIERMKYMATFGIASNYWSDYGTSFFDKPVYHIFLHLNFLS